MTPLDIAVNSFFTSAGGVDFLGTFFAIPIIFAIIFAMIKPFDI
jgi:hypothetical protein